MASTDEPASNTASSSTHQTQAESSTTSSMPDITQLSFDHNPDIFTIVCCNDSFQLALDHSTIKTLLRVCKRAQPLLSSKVPRFYTWCQSMELLNPDGQMQIGLTPSDQIAISLHCEDQVPVGRSWLVALANQGNAFASYLLARMLQSEIDSQTDDDDEPEENTKQQQVFSLLEATANARHTMVHFHLAECYSKGVGVDQDHTKAVELYRSLADHGIPQAQVALGRCYENGDGVDQDYETAIEWYSKAPDQGSEDGRLHVVFLRGWFSFIGHGVKQSDADAFNHWHEVSNLSADPIIKSIATHMVGWMHYLGRGTVRDEQKGVKIIRDNQSDGFKLGEDECLAGFLNDILSDSPAPRKFFNLCQLGSDRDWLCEHLMGVCMANGFGTTKDRKKAAAIFEQLAADGHSDSQLWIGVCYWCHGGVSGYRKKAFKWFIKSADQGNSFGQYWVGDCYFDGLYELTKSRTKAVEWYRKSAEQGNRYGQNNLGHCYQYGRGVPQNIDTAVFWFRKSAEQGDEDAIGNLKELDQWP